MITLRFPTRRSFFLAYAYVSPDAPERLQLAFNDLLGMEIHKQRSVEGKEPIFLSESKSEGPQTNSHIMRPTRVLPQTAEENKADSFSVGLQRAYLPSNDDTVHAAVEKMQSPSDDGSKVFRRTHSKSLNAHYDALYVAVEKLQSPTDDGDSSDSSRSTFSCSRVSSDSSTDSNSSNGTRQFTDRSLRDVSLADTSLTDVSLVSASESTAKRKDSSRRDVAHLSRHSSVDSSSLLRPCHQRLSQLAMLSHSTSIDVGTIDRYEYVSNTKFHLDPSAPILKTLLGSLPLDSELNEEPSVVKDTTETLQGVNQGRSLSDNCPSSPFRMSRATAKKGVHPNLPPIPFSSFPRAKHVSPSRSEPVNPHPSAQDASDPRVRLATMASELDDDLLANIPVAPVFNFAPESSEFPETIQMPPPLRSFSCPASESSLFPGGRLPSALRSPGTPPRIKQQVSWGGVEVKEIPARGVKWDAPFLSHQQNHARGYGSMYNLVAPSQKLAERSIAFGQVLRQGR
eukprot:TRINITY_DN20733_c0_g1_i1.p1 TRINITY_DN20733_c0_g1~~TRINITY_DN20733_c0_g1_i1.p1  ORF type:complete len:512 (-),score=39.89 TRINITY_DN20733_c0_g1_i1:949-2484(-)